MEKLTTYISEVRLELTKVTWPKKREITRLTLLVFVISAIVAVYLGAFDFALTKLLSQILTR